jgi:hypothetical protein
VATVYKNNDEGAFSKYIMAAKPNQVIEVMCQANLRVFLVNSSLPNNSGILSLRNKRIKMYFSPKYECAIPVVSMITAAMVNIDMLLFRLKLFGNH